MSFLKSPKELEALIPEPNTKVYECMVTKTPEKALLLSSIFAVTINEKENKIVSINRASFTLFSSPNSAYLFINKSTEKIDSNTPYVRARVKEGKRPTINDWGFEVDELGLYIKTGMFKNRKIYFVTSIFDVKKFNEIMKKKVEEKTLVAETVYV